MQFYYVASETKIAGYLPKNAAKAKCPSTFNPRHWILTYYFVNGIFLEEGFILKHCSEKLKNIPVDIVQGRYDVVCPAKSAWELHQALPHSKLVIIPDAGHSMGEVGIAEELVKITNKYR